MDFNSYLEKLQLLASSKEYTIEETKKCIAYATKLHEKGLPIIFDTTHFSKLVGYNKSYIKKAVVYTSYFYREFRVPKKNGSFRLISEPLPSLKEIQRWILAEILYKNPVHAYCKAYVPGKNIKGNARFHTGRHVVLALDIHDFFGSIDITKVEECFRNMGYTSILSSLFSKLCCLDNKLPQGAPTSPYLTNIIMYDFDKEIEAYCREHEFFYTRYADDMSFSGSFDISALKSEVKTKLSCMGLTLNDSKTKIMGRGERQIVTGIVVNKKMSITSDEKREIRQIIYFITKYGLENHLEHIECNKRNYLKHLLGRINYALFLKPSDNELKRFRAIVQGFLDYRDESLI